MQLEIQCIYHKLEMHRSSPLSMSSYSHSFFNGLSIGHHFLNILLVLNWVVGHLWLSQIFKCQTMKKFLRVTGVFIDSVQFVLNDCSGLCCEQCILSLFWVQRMLLRACSS